MATAMPARSSRLADDAATAALYVTHPERKASMRAPTAPNTYFNPRAGGTPNLSHASAASALAHANRKPVEVWQPPARQPAAEKAAYSVKDYTPPQPPQAPTGHSAAGLGAALLAVRGEQRTAPAQKPTHKRGISVDQHRDRYYTAVGGDPQEKALQAATGAYTQSCQRADSAPCEPGPSEVPLSRSAAGASRHVRMGSDVPLGHLDNANEVSRISHIANTNAKLYTSNPPVQAEIEEQNYKNSLRAASISMAKDMYKVNGTKEETKEETGGVDPAVLAAQKGQSQLGYRKTVSSTDRSALRSAIALQDAAQKRAAEKLALMHDENAEYLEYYGTAPQPPRSRLTTRRKRTSSDADASQIDAEQSRHIRNQMSSLRTKMDQVDTRRTKDRELLMQAARRNVDATLQDMETRYYAKTGRAPPSVQRSWDEVAQERVRQEAEASEVAAAEGERVNIGGQRYMDMADVEAVARTRLQPALDEITDNAEQRRAEELEARLDAEEKQRHAAVERQREAELRELEKQEKGTNKRENKSEGKVSIPKFFLWRKKGKRARVEESETAQAQPVSPVAQDTVGVVEPTPSGTADIDASIRTIPEEASSEARVVASESEVAATEPEVGTKEPEEATNEPEVAAATGTLAATAPSMSVASAAEADRTTGTDVPPAVPRRQSAPLQTEPRDAAASTSGSTMIHHFERPVSSPRADSKLKTWFRDRLVRRSSGPVPVYPHQPGPDFNTDSEPAFQGGAALTGRDETRGAALSSHPMAGSDSVPVHNRSSSYYSNDYDMAKSRTQDSSPESITQQNGNGKKPSRLRRTFLKSVSRGSDEPMTNGPGDSRRGSEVPSAKSKDTAGTDLQNLRNSAAEQGLPAPPPIGETGSVARESRFSEDL
ncbi:hypothetical protein N7508_004546 [Penicillium antarcticum]|uniref:uncharacterized protein n=1 Tax=Penicillium antarcticum TaxID=416450 RepID=UPI00238EAE70|nr:uncharacterized protein N7508_004546 [Penicillium antarcticum]KAJ5309167.1 hypothetical protein N7508_004546 [Penicillium antarcticum]